MEGVFWRDTFHVTKSVVDVSIFFNNYFLKLLQKLKKPAKPWPPNQKKRPAMAEKSKLYLTLFQTFGVWKVEEICRLPLCHFCHGRKFVHQSCHLGFLINDLANSLSQALTTCLVLFKGANMSLFSAASFSSKWPYFLKVWRSLTQRTLLARSVALSPLAP